jgi:NADH-quinone oxidoreductase subunit M
MRYQYLLLILLALPLVTVVAVALLGAIGPKVRAIRALCLGSTVLGLVLSAILAVAYAVPSVAAAEKVPAKENTFTAQFATEFPVLTIRAVEATADRPAERSAIEFFVGLDGLNVWLIVLTELLMVSSVLISWNAIDQRVPEYYAWLMVLNLALLGVFMAFDVILFYVFFELTLVPLFFLIGIWGGAQRQYAARKFFAYTLAGSLVTLLGVIGVVVVIAQDGAEKKLTFSMPELVTQVDAHGKHLNDDLAGAVKANADGPAANEARKAVERWRTIQFWVFVAMMCGFAIKVPLVPVHTWLPLAHVEAPTAGSVLLAGVLLKLGSYGFLRLCLPLAPDASLTFGAPVIGVLSVIGIIYGSACALMQPDIKKLVAYSSVAHMGFCMMGLFAINAEGISGGIMQMLNHGLSTGALFLLVGMLYERYHTRKIVDYSGMAARLKLLAFFFVFITMSSIGLPGLNGFIGETLTMLGMYTTKDSHVRGQLLAGLATVGVVMGAWYMLTLVMKVFFGPLREPGHGGHGEHGEHKVGDLNIREIAALGPIVVLCIALGMYPQPVLDSFQPEVKTVVGIVERARQRQDNQPQLARTVDAVEEHP